MPDRTDVAQALAEQASQRAGTIWPNLTAYAPNVGVESMAHRPDVAGRFDPSTRSVMLNQARTQPMNQEQATGLIGLERARGLLASPLGQQWTDQMPLPQNQRQWWEQMYLPPSVDAPTDPQARDRILKSTMLSRLLVGDTMPPDAPPLTPEQAQLGSLFSAYARKK